ncbi:hypothetical protein AZO1586I_237 [Bathymodiolus thermophilus thioautotrophic gill symbiont]|uniref:Uncharacterized protein n=2 Tax=Bathymodiolus thermophilus thioautotrophic gill symbiont TaxID=2360 RepID=A0ABN7G9I2_9GAMM|nr:hypothetical protein [Bathymodiolus thermophilus thioautotrophic gill symbiont]CAB5497820.1 hypothetical protein AZO1586I_237 [Bathymodiolus thermophilus thioautotrophic gill symbiont]
MTYFEKALKNACKKTDYNCKIVVQKMELTTMKKANNTTNFKTYTKAFVTGVLVFGLLGITNTSIAIANQNSTIDNYNERYTPQGRKQAGKRGTYRKDTNVWVYTSAFAKRFGMPQQWIDDDLKGAEALAYRLDLDVYGTKCGYFSDVESCRPSTACVVDMYIDDKANLPWNNKARYASKYGRKSNALLWPQDPNDKPAYLYRRTKRGQQYKMGLDVVYVSGSKIPLNNYHLLEYDRDIYKNLDYISGSMTCDSFGKSRDIKIEIDKPALRKSGSIKYNYGSLAHSITVPNSFMERIETYDKAQYEPNSLFKALRGRLSTTTKSNQSK